MYTLFRMPFVVPYGVFNQSINQSGRNNENNRPMAIVHDPAVRYQKCLGPKSDTTKISNRKKYKWNYGELYENEHLFNSPCLKFVSFLPLSLKCDQFEQAAAALK